MNDDNICKFPARPRVQHPAPKVIKFPAPGNSNEPGTFTSPVEHHKQANLRMLDAARRLVESGQLEGLIIIGRHSEGKVFHTNHALTQDVIPGEELYSFIGVLQSLSGELVDVAAGAASELLEDGSIIDPRLA